MQQQQQQQQQQVMPPARRVLVPFSLLLLTACCVYLCIWHLATYSSSSTMTLNNNNNNNNNDTTCQQQQLLTADVAIIGGGLAGLAASIEASRLNPSLRILLLEKEPKLGGNSAKASSGINAALDAHDAPLFQEDTLRSGGGLSVEQMVRVFVDQSPDAIAFLEQSGVDLSVLSQLGGHSAKRTHRNEKGPNIGFAIVSALQKQIASDGDDDKTKKIQVVTGVAVEKVRFENGHVTGLQISRPSESGGPAESQLIDAPAVILATGGFSANLELLKKFAPGMEEFPTTNGPWATGDGLALAQGVGADLVLMDKVQLHPTAFVNPKDRDAKQKFLAPEAIRGSGALLVNMEGKRFVNELTTRNHVSQAILAQPGKSAFLLLFDGAKHLESSLGFYKHIGLVKQVHSVAEAAEYCRFEDPQALLQVFTAYADSAAGKQPDAFGKSVFPYPLQHIESVDAPVEIHIMEVEPAVHYTMGGVKTNENAQVLRADGSAVAGLYAAGEVSGGLHGLNRLGGNSLAECVVFGRIAAQQAVHQLQQEQPTTPPPFRKDTDRHSQQLKPAFCLILSMSMSSSDDASHGDGGVAGNEDAFAYSSSGGDEEEGGSSAEDSADDEDAIFITSRSEIVISPRRRRIGASLWGQLEERMGAQQRSDAQRMAEQMGADAFRSRRAAAAPAATDGQQSKSSKTKTKRTSSSSSSKIINTRANSNRDTRRMTTTRDDAGDERVTIKRGSSRSAAVAQKEAPRRDQGLKSQMIHRSSSAIAAPAISSSADASRRKKGGVRSRRREDDDLERKSHSSSESSESSGGEAEHHEDGSRRSQKEMRNSRNDGAGDSESSAQDEREPSSQAKRSSKLQSAEMPTSRSTSTRKQTRARQTEVPMSPSSAALSLSSSAFSQASQPQTQKPASFLSDASATGFSAAVLPSPKEEMEELKQTLKKLASHDHNASSNKSDPTATSSATTVAPGGEFLRVATGLLPPSSADQLRLGEYVSSQSFANGPAGKDHGSTSTSSFLKQRPSGKDSRHASFDPAALSAKLHARETSNNNSSRSKSLIANGSRGDDYQPPTSSSRDNPRLSINKKLFGQMPNASSYDNPYSSHTNGPSSGGAQGMLGSGLGLGGGGAAGAQGSRAVLSALKALQDKIRRLEEERETLMQQLSDEKVRARKREAELASSEKKFSYELGQTKESARAAYDAIRNEREELKVELVRADERRKSLESEINHVQALLGTYSSKADDLQTQLEISESQHKRLQSDLEQLKAELKSENRDLRAKMQALEQQETVSQEQLKLMDAQFQRESSNHAETRERLRDSEQSVASISQLNEKLVARVWEVTDVANKTAKQNKKLLSQQRVSTVSKSTAASRASAAAAPHAGREAGGGTGAMGSRRATGGATALNARQRASGVSESVTTTSSRLRKKTATSTTSSSGAASGIKRAAGAKKTKSQPSDMFINTNNMALLRDANLGKEIPFLLGTSSNPSFSIIGNVQDAIRQCDSTYVTPDTLNGGAPIRIPTALGRTPRSAPQPAHEQQQRTPKSTRRTVKSSSGVSAKILGMHEATPTTLLSDRTRGSASASGGAVEKRHKPSAIQVPPPAPVSAYINPMQTQIMDDLSAALQSAETEFATLNARYKDIVSRMKAEGSSGSGSSAQLSSALGPLLDELEAKGKQVNLLKQVYQQASNSSINPLRRIVHSPEAIRRKTASLRLLNEYRQLERDARSSPPHQRNTSSSFFSDHE